MASTNCDTRPDQAINCETSKHTKFSYRLRVLFPVHNKRHANFAMLRHVKPSSAPPALLCHAELRPALLCHASFAALSYASLRHDPPSQASPASPCSAAPGQATPRYAPPASPGPPRLASPCLLRRARLRHAKPLSAQLGHASFAVPR